MNNTPPFWSGWMSGVACGALALTPVVWPAAGGYAVATLIGWGLLTAVHVGQKDRRRR